MILTELGKIVEECWTQIPKHFKMADIDYYIIMPNHLHGIVIINPIVETGYIPSQDELFETPDRASLYLLVDEKPLKYFFEIFFHIASFKFSKII